MLLESYRDRKLSELYSLLTHSDMKGSLQDEYVICTLYAMRCIDASKAVTGKQILALAKEAMRAYEYLMQREDVSLDQVIEALIESVRDGEHDCHEIHKLDCFELGQLVMGRT